MGGPRYDMHGGANARRKWNIRESRTLERGWCLRLPTDLPNWGP